MKTTFVALILSVVLSAATVAQAATLINVDFSAFATDTFSGAAALGSAGDTWNGIVNLDNATSGALVDSTNTATSATITIGDVIFTSASGTAVAATDAVDLMKDYLFKGGSISASIDGLDVPGSGQTLAYTLVLYGAGDTATQQGTFTVTGANEASQATIGALAAPLASPQHYVTFTGNTNSGSINFDWAGNAFNGFQLSTELVPTVPEPTSLLLAGLGVVGLCVSRRRRSR